MGLYTSDTEEEFEKYKRFVKNAFIRIKALEEGGTGSGGPITKTTISGASNIAINYNDGSSIYYIDSLTANRTIDVLNTVDTDMGLVVVGATNGFDLIHNGTTLALPASGAAVLTFVNISGNIIWTVSSNVASVNDSPANTVPPAPTGGVVDDTANTFTFILATGYAAADHEYRINGGSWTATSSNVISVGNINIAAGGLEVRVKAATGRDASAVLVNAESFTEIAVPQDVTFALLTGNNDSGIAYTIEKTGTYWAVKDGTGSTTYGHTAVSTTQKIPAGQPGIFYVTTANTDFHYQIHIGFSTTATKVTRTTMPIGSRLANTNLFRIENGVEQTPAVPSNGMSASTRVGIRRRYDGGPNPIYELVTSVDSGATWIFKAAYTITYDGDLYPAIDILRGRLVESPKIEGAITV